MASSPSTSLLVRANGAPAHRKSYKRAPKLPTPEEARAAGLRYISDRVPGLRRRRTGTGFQYFDGEGRRVLDQPTLERIRALAIPPAWREVWICPSADGHIQATGRDARGRKQYRYHVRWREARDETKYERMMAFAKALPRIRRRVARDLARPGLSREKALATVVRLLEATGIRVGNDEYARENDSFGLTTLRERQVHVRGGQLKFRFRGKSGVQHDIRLDDPRLAHIVRRMQDLPGEELFQYVGDDGAVHRVASEDVNAYLKEISGEDFTSKDFRTWTGTVLAARALHAIPQFASQAEAKRNVVRAIESVAQRLGNTKAVCRKCYIHPAIIESYLEGALVPAPRGRSQEASVLRVLQAHVKRDAEKARRSGADGASLGPVLRRSIARAAQRLRRGKGRPTSTVRGTA